MATKNGVSRGKHGNKHDSGKNGKGQAQVTGGSINVRVEQPVQGCALVPFTLVRQRRGDRDEILSDSDSTMTFCWYRSSSMRVCVNPKCPSARGFPGFAVAQVLCISCENVGLPKHLSHYCSASCFREVRRLLPRALGGVARRM